MPTLTAQIAKIADLPFFGLFLIENKGEGGIEVALRVRH